MVGSPAMMGLGVAAAVSLVVLCAEWVHARRVRRVAHLAFGARGRARVWASASPWVRVVGSGLAAWGLVVLALHESEGVEAVPTSEASKHLLVCLDASPSMYVADAGPTGKEKRAVWAGEVVQAILDRLDTETTRVTVIAVYTKAIPVVEETFDLNVVRNVLVGLPLFAAFDPGTTRLGTGVSEALEYARRWPARSATLVVVSDGDAEEEGSVRFVPTSIADSIVIGVGDPVRPTLVAGHRSRQEVASLRTLATRLRGVYHNGNTKHLPSAMLDRLTMIRPRVADAIGLREAAVVAAATGSVALAVIGPILVVAGRREREVGAVAPGRVRVVALGRR